RPSPIHSWIPAPEPPLHPHPFEAAPEHAAVPTAAREIEENVARPPPHPQRGERVLPVPAPPDVREDEVHVRMTLRERAQLEGVRGLLPRPIAPPVLPHVVQHRESALARELADRIEQGIVRPPARGELDADHTGGAAAVDFAQ